jgi:cyclopropane-fatty-acyl-phospholipid synthase
LRGALASRLAGLKHGSLTLHDGIERLQFGSAEGGQSEGVHVTVKDSRFYSAVVLNGSVGAAESFARGWWTASDLTAAIRILVRNREAMLALDGGLAHLSAPARGVVHWMKRNTRSGSELNIAAHYDLGNSFFEKFLDETWMYSAAYFENEEMTLAEASRAKIDRLCRKLKLCAKDHLLEIGTGWGGLALQAAQTYGCKVTSATISREQYNLARARVQAAGLADRIEVVFCDYRDLQGTYDKLVSVEMIEAVGHQYLGEYLSCCERLLKPGGLFALQCITIGDADYERHTREVDFIKRWIFPGSCLVNVSRIREILNGSPLRVTQEEDVTHHYVRTLQEWRANFVHNRTRILSEGYDEEFWRLWYYYFSYCEAGFAENYIGTQQLVLEKTEVVASQN